MKQPPALLIRIKMTAAAGLLYRPSAKKIEPGNSYGLVTTIDRY
jgi:hypothetical protein